MTTIWRIRRISIEAYLTSLQALKVVQGHSKLQRWVGRVSGLTLLLVNKCKKNCCFITMCKAHSKVTHIKQQKYFHHLKRPGYNTDFLLYPRPFRWWKYFCCFICVTLLWALHIVIKQQFFTFIFAVFLLNLLYTGCYS